MLNWFGHVKRMNEKVSSERCRRRSRLTFENTVPKILEEGHVKSIRTHQRVCIKRLMTLDEDERGTYVETVAFSAQFSLTTPLGIKREVKCFKN